MAKKGVSPKSWAFNFFFMMLGDHIQCISEEISFIGFCLTFSAIIGWIKNKIITATLLPVPATVVYV